jgi:hypothetical protein
VKILEIKNAHFCKFRDRRSFRFAFNSWIKQAAGPNLSPNSQGSSPNLNPSLHLSSLAEIYNPGGRPNQSSNNMMMTAPRISSSQAALQVNINSRSANELFILFGVEGGRQTLEFAQLDVTRQDDAMFFRALKERYRELRGFWRYWLSVWQLNHCDFVQVCSPLFPFQSQPQT